MMCAPLPIRLLGLLLLLVVVVLDVSAFVVPSRTAASSSVTFSGVETPSTPVFVPKPEEGSTSLHVGGVYGPYQGTADFNTPMKMLQRRNGKNRRFEVANNGFFDVDPAFSAVSTIVMDARMAQQELLEAQQRKQRQVIAASAAVACAVLISKQMVAWGGLPYLISKIPFCYKAYPLKASIATCGLNSIVGDSISQMQGWKPSEGIFTFQWRQHVASLVYGSTILGIGSNMVYTKLLPALFPHGGITSIISSAILDNFVFAPMLWLPPAYMIKAWFLKQPIKQALNQYKNDIFQEKLLLRYWSLWIPAQMFMFAVVPKHLRVAATAAVSFVWLLILTKLTSKKN
ncbi:Mpv17 / PMP22 family [Seminavis robusta]|uniref:Mpv17 / PMP22 family n=1 Tax=Seminavis robusta TaxID=568900 RepID=A0A9N8EFH3_9STRA|nr:Mpv17 / PMP22 family [Seminavis robusta]|eukprot:Sro868_g213320.1 Mpv17 / PMP22 family (344) ;mRNA; f:26756-27787